MKDERRSRSRRASPGWRIILRSHGALHHHRPATPELAFTVRVVQGPHRTRQSSEHRGRPQPTDTAMRRDLPLSAAPRSRIFRSNGRTLPTLSAAGSRATTRYRNEGRSCGRLFARPLVWVIDSSRLPESMTTPATLAYSVDNCTVGRTIAILGERSTLLVIREVLTGIRRFDDMRVRTAIPRQVLADRAASPGRARDSPQGAVPAPRAAGPSRVPPDR